MAIDVLYEAIEYGKVLLGYVFFMFAVPSVVFYKHLQHRPPVYRFGFCVTVVPVCLNMLVLALGLIHILSMPLTALILAGVFGVSAVRLIWARRQDLQAQKRLRSFRILRSWWREDAVYKGLWAVTLLFGAVYFAYGAFQVSCYGYGDLYVHHAWIHGLMQGEIYKGGIYPEAMHCFVYCMRALLGISVFSSLRFLQCVHTAVFLTSAGCLLREMFRWRYMPVLTLLLFLTLDVRGGDMIRPMSRLQWSLPMEFGLPYVFLCALFLIRYIKREEPEDKCAYWKDENLFMFALSLAALLVTHYHTVIMAFLICLSVVLCAFRRVFRPRRWLPLMAAALCILLITSVPMACALAGGTPFENSIRWALGSMSGEEARENQAILEAAASGEESAADKAEAAQAADNAGESAGVYRGGYARLYGKGRGALLLALSCLSLALCLAGKLRRAKWAEGAEYGYLSMLLMSVIFVVTYAMPYMGFPDIISEGRFCAIGHPLTLAAALIPLDIAAVLAVERCGEALLRKAAVLAAVGIYAAVRLTGNYHGFLYYELSRYPAAVTLTRTIMEDCEPYTYAIVSPTDELYQIVEKGNHIELLNFLDEIEEKEEYTLGYDDLFFFVEKKPLYYAQLYFVEGPSWLGEERYPESCREEFESLYSTWRISQAPDVIASEISRDKAEREIPETGSWQKYTRLENREVLESKAYEQCMRLMEAYPDQMEIYYEDEAFICFHLEQPGRNRCNLAAAQEEQPCLP